jgi:hypothetical protein
MLADLDRLIRLQKLETFADDARRTIADHPARTLALEARLEQATGAVEAVRQRLTDSQAARGGHEKEMATVQARLTKYKDQLLEVKTNREYQAMLHEIAAAQAEVERFEELVLERMLEADELAKAISQAETELKTAQTEVAAERSELDAEVRRLETELEKTTAERAALVAEISPSAVLLFETVARGRRGVGIAEARDGLCTLCHVRMRPQVFNEVLRNDTIIQCDSCQRILYFTAKPAPAAASPVATAPGEARGTS